MRVWDKKAEDWVEIPEDTLKSQPDRFETWAQHTKNIPKLIEKHGYVITSVEKEPEMTIQSPPTSPTIIDSTTHVISSAAFAGALAELVDYGLNYLIHVDIPSGFAIALTTLLTPFASPLLKWLSRYS